MILCLAFLTRFSTPSVLQAKDTPLIKAVRHNKIDCVKVLLELGVDIKAVDSVGYTPAFLSSIFTILTVCVLFLSPPGGQDGSGVGCRVEPPRDHVFAA